MKVLIAHRQMAIYGGAELVIVRLARYLKGRGHSVRIVATDTKLRSEYEGLDIITPKNRMEWHVWKVNATSVIEILTAMNYLHGLVKEQAEYYDVINTHNFPALWASPSGKPMVWMCNELPDTWHMERLGIASRVVYKAGRLFDRWQVHRHKANIVVADDAMRGRVIERYGLVPTVIPYGIDGKYFSNGSAELNGKFQIIHTAIISPSKCQMETVKAMGQHDKLVLVGHAEGGYKDEVMCYALHNSLDVDIIGQVDRELLRSIYYKSHVAVFPGKGQGSWLSPFEALAAGCPVIVSPNLTCSRIIAENELGIVSSDLRQSLNIIKDNYPIYKKQALRAREYVLKNMTWDNFCRRYEELLECSIG